MSEELNCMDCVYYGGESDIGLDEDFLWCRMNYSWKNENYICKAFMNIRDIDNV